MKYRILLADDEYLEREVVKMILQSRPDRYMVVGEAENGLEALNFTKNNTVDLVLMDIKMPQMTGLEAARYMKEFNPNIGVVLVTAYSDFEFAQNAIKYSVDDYLLKPTRPEHLFEAIEATMKKISYHKVKQKEPVKDLITSFLNYCRGGDYIRAKKALRAIQRTKFETYEMEVEVTKELLQNLLTVADYFNIDVERNLELKIKEKLQESNSRDHYFSILRMIFEEIFTVVIEEKKVAYDDEMTYALQYIEKNLTKDLTLENAASYMNISPHYFSKLFKNDVGENFIDYVTRKKMQRAKELIRRTDQPLNAIAFELGFNEANYFSKVFKKVEGLTPSQYRKKMLDKQKEELMLLQKGSATRDNWRI